MVNDKKTKMNEINIFDAIKERLSMPDYIFSLPDVNVPKNKKGSTQILCPVHSEKTPSFSFTRNSCKCFGCGVGGSVIDLHMAIRKFSSPADAAKDLIKSYSPYFTPEILDAIEPKKRAINPELKIKFEN